MPAIFQAVHALLRRLSMRWGWQRPVLIFQMGKVGSVTLQKTLQAAGRPNLHLHTLQNHPEARAVAERIRAGQRRWKIITLVRDPVAQRIAAFFENLHCPDSPFYFGPQDKVLAASVPELGEHFLKTAALPEIHPFQWFDNNLMPSFHWDALSAPFDPEQGYALYHTPQADILLIRYEDLWWTGRQALVRFLNLPNHLEWIPANLSEQRYFAGHYAAFKSQWQVPAYYLEALYSSPYTRHFYTPEEIILFQKRWTLQEFCAPFLIG